MKKLMIVTLILGASFQAATAKIWRVNNTNGVTADFTTPSAAETGASAGDTIQIEGSLIGYGSVTCTKQLIWIGPGYFLAENPETQYNLDTATGTDFTFTTGSSGSMVMGMYNPNFNIQTNFITILRNDGPSITLGTSNDSTYSGIVIEQNYNCTIYNYSSYSTISGLQVFSNYIVTLYLQNTASTGGTLYSNVISNLDYLNGCLVEDNIIHGDTIAFSANNTFYYNIIYNGSYNTSPAESTNYNFYVSDFTTIFVNWSSAAALDDNLELASGASPAKGQGNGGIDLGIFGSGTPYILSGMPAVPSIYGLTGPNSVASGATTMNMTVSIKSHN